MIQTIQRTALSLAILMTIIFLIVSIIPAAGRTFTGQAHWVAHVIAYAIFGLVWRGALLRTPDYAVILLVSTIGIVQEVIEMYGHGHAFELSDVFIDMGGAIIAVLFASFVINRIVLFYFMD